MKPYRILALAVALTVTLAKGVTVENTVTGDLVAPPPLRLQTVASMTDLKVREHGFPDLEASYLEHCAKEVHHGTPGITLRFTNSAVKERHFLISVADHYYAETKKRFTLPPGGTVEFTLFMPFRPLDVSFYSKPNLLLVETTPGVKMTDINPAFGGFRFPGNRCRNTPPSMLLSGRLSANRFRDDLTKAKKTGQYTPKHGDPGHRYGSTKETPTYAMTAVQFTFPAAQWPRDWRGYSTYDAVAITDGEYAELSEETKSALNAYRLFGGAVIVTKGANGFADGEEAIQALKAIDTSYETLSGDNYTPISTLLNQIPIKSKSTLPVKTLLLVLAVFALVIVPLAILRGVKRNRRMRLLAILPGAAALFAAAIALTAFLFFGSTPSVRLQSITLLDQPAKKALTHGQCAIFSPVSIERYLSFPIDATFAKRSTSTHESDRQPLVNVTDAQRLGGRWVTPLVTVFFDFDRFCDRSEKLDFRVAASGEVSVVNLLGARIVKGQANIGGELWTFHDIPPGGRAAAEKKDVKPKPPRQRYPFGSATDFGRDWRANLSFARKVLDDLPVGEYIAEVDGSPFLPNPVSGKATDTQAEGIIYGKFKEVAE